MTYKTHIHTGMFYPCLQCESYQLLSLHIVAAMKLCTIRRAYMTVIHTLLRVSECSNYAMKSSAFMSHWAIILFILHTSLHPWYYTIIFLMLPCHASIVNRCIAIYIAASAKRSLVEAVLYRHVALSTVTSRMCGVVPLIRIGVLGVTELL
jgi:hypothetical protein